MTQEVLFKERKTCRASGNKLKSLFSLGELPISDFVTDLGTLQFAPIELCFDEESKLLQLKHTVDGDKMYSKYWYKSGINSSMTASLKDIVEEAMKRVDLNYRDIVLDIACNDGTLLKQYPNKFELLRVGIDPSDIDSPYLRIRDFFSKDVYRSVYDRPAKIITSIAVFYDLENPVTFASDIREILDDNGLWILEMSYMPTMVRENLYDTICAEHLEYYSLTSLDYIIGKAGMFIEDVEFNGVNGGSIRLYVRKSSKNFVRKFNLRSLLSVEEKGGFTTVDGLKKFESNIKKAVAETQSMLRLLKQEGKTVIGYGASTKGNTTMALCGINEELMPYVADRNPDKFGRMTVTGIPIISEQDARDMKPDYFFMFPYHFVDEFIKREEKFLEHGGRFITPVPYPKIL